MHRIMNLKTEQQALYEKMPRDARCFVRVCDSDDALWVSDLPRRYSGLLAEVEGVLAESGFACRLDEKSGLWYLDFTPEYWQEIIGGFPRRLPSFPKEERYHPAYALCRLWLSHPTPWSGGQLPVIRRVFKLTNQTEEALLRAVPSLHEQAACDLRKGLPCAHAAGRMLARWLMERR